MLPQADLLVCTCGKGLGHHPDNDGSSVATAQLDQQVHDGPAYLPRQSELRLRRSLEERPPSRRKPKPFVLGIRSRKARRESEEFNTRHTVRPRN